MVRAYVPKAQSSELNLLATRGPISAATNDFESVIQKIAECEVLLSYSLHGLIVADALQIPNEWIQGNIHIAGAFKNPRLRIISRPPPDRADFGYLGS